MTSRQTVLYLRYNPMKTRQSKTGIATASFLVFFFFFQPAFAFFPGEQLFPKSNYSGVIAGIVSSPLSALHSFSRLGHVLPREVRTLRFATNRALRSIPTDFGSGNSYLDTLPTLTFPSFVVPAFSLAIPGHDNLIVPSASPRTVEVAGVNMTIKKEVTNFVAEIINNGSFFLGANPVSASEK